MLMTFNFGKKSNNCVNVAIVIKKGTVIISIFLLSILYACSPSMEMPLGPMCAKREMPRYCFRDRLFFYQVNGDEKWMQVWYASSSNLTADQLTHKPLNIYLADGNKRNIKFYFQFTESPKKSNIDGVKDKLGEPELALYKVTENGTIDITADHTFRIATHLEKQKYEAKIDFPSALIKNLEEPVMGIVSKADYKKLLDKKNASRPSNADEIRHANQRHNSYSQQSRQPQARVAYQHQLPDIEVWFKLELP